jgi:hypothetical protein
MLDRLELVLAQIAILEAQRDAAPARAEGADAAEAMMHRLAGLRGAGVGALDQDAVGSEVDVGLANG